MTDDPLIVAGFALGAVARRWSSSGSPSPARMRPDRAPARPEEQHPPQRPARHRRRRLQRPVGRGLGRPRARDAGRRARPPAQPPQRVSRRLGVRRPDLRRLRPLRRRSRSARGAGGRGRRHHRFRPRPRCCAASSPPINGTPDRRHAAARPRGLVPARGRSADDLPRRAARQLEARRRRVVAGRLRRPAARLAPREPPQRPRHQPRRRGDLHDLRRRDQSQGRELPRATPGRAASTSSRPSRPACSRPIPTTLLAAVTAAPGREQDVERILADTVPDIYFIPIGQTLEADRHRPEPALARRLAGRRHRRRQRPPRPHRQPRHGPPPAARPTR